jgi:hypothetical protein
LSAFRNHKPIKVTIELPVAVHRGLVVYAEIFSTERTRDRHSFEAYRADARAIYGNESGFCQGVPRSRAI